MCKVQVRLWQGWKPNFMTPQIIHRLPLMENKFISIKNLIKAIHVFVFGASTIV